MTTEVWSVLIPALAALAGGVITWWGKIVLELIKAKPAPPAPSQIGTEACEKIIDGRIYRHESHCHNLEIVMARLDTIAKTTREDLLNYRNDLAGQLQHIVEKIDRHIEAGDRR